MKLYTTFFTLCLAFLLTATYAQPLDMSLLKDMKPRNIGPAGMSGRVTAIDVVTADPDIIYIGTASGGVWKSENGGTSWKPLFQKEKAASIGSIAINQNNPAEIWVGTGEGNPRNSLSHGYGVFRSLDGGLSWEHMGLEQTKNIHRLILHPTDPNIIYAGAIGYPWTPHEERGVYKSSDGGKNWRRVLFTNDKSGTADLVMDPSNPNKLIAAMWDHQRWPWFFYSGGEGSGIYISHDGGEHWEKKGPAHGLPKGEIGRIGLAIAPGKPNIVYALVESKKTGLYRSEDGGMSWKLQADKNIGSRPFYYADIFVDPKNENRLINLHTFVTISQDGGKSFEPFINPALIHVDNHAFWIHPEDPSYMICGNDGGMCITRDGGKTWDFPENLPLAQFYHIRVDDAIPYNVYGGLQDNGSWRGPSQVWRIKGIRNLYWNRIGTGDGFDAMADPNDPRYGYAMAQGGNLIRYDLETGTGQRLKPFLEDGRSLRFNWNAGIDMDPFDNQTLYYGAQYLLKSSDKGSSWEAISPDLTTNDPDKQQQLITGGLTYDNSGAENYTTIISVDASPVQEGVIWVGTDDGYVQVTEDGGKNWKNVTGNIPGFPEGGWVCQVNASTYKAGEAFVVVNDYRRGDWTPYLFHTSNFGRSWKRLADSENVWGYTLSFVQDPIEPKLMFLGTEFGLYVSIDGAKNWTKWTNGYPTVSTMDMAIQAREHDLVLGTFGRAVWILDDIRPLRKMAQDGIKNINSQAMVSFPSPVAYLTDYGQANGYRSTGNGIFAGQNRQAGALLSLYIGELPDSASASVKVSIKDKNGKLVRDFKQKIHQGLNRFNWDLSRKGVRYPQSPKPKAGAASPKGTLVLPGTYTVTFEWEGNKSDTEVKVILPPQINISQEEMEAKEALINQHYTLVEKVTDGIDKLREAKSTIAMLTKKMKADQLENETFMATSKEIDHKIDALIGLVNSPPMQGFSRDMSLIQYQLSNVAGMLQSILYPVTSTQKHLVNHSEKNANEVLASIQSFFETDWSQYKEAVEELDLSWIKDY